MAMTQTMKKELAAIFSQLAQINNDQQIPVLYQGCSRSLFDASQKINTQWQVFSKQKSRSMSHPDSKKYSPKNSQKDSKSDDNQSGPATNQKQSLQNDTNNDARQLIHTRLLKRWQGSPYYEKLNQAISRCDACAKDKLGFVPTYGIGFVETQDSMTDMQIFRPELLVISDPPMNFFIQEDYPHTPKSVFVAGQQNDWRLDLGKEKNWAAANQWLQEYKDYFPEAVSLFFNTLNNSGFNPGKMIFTSVGRCFLTKQGFKKYFGENNKGPRCADWLKEELEYLLARSRPRAILSLSSHFPRIFLDQHESLEDLHKKTDLSWQNIPVRTLYHPYQWVRNASIRKTSQRYLEQLYKTLLK